MKYQDQSPDSVRRHYDRLSLLYLALWGEHIHHGYWTNGESPAEAQIGLIARLAERAGLPKGAKVLDVGCGLGGSSLWLARNWNCRLVGITISPVQAALAKWRARAAGLSHAARFLVMDANRLDFPPRSFDAVWVIECSEHLNDKRRFIQSCADLLRPGGILALCSWLVPDRPDDRQQTRLLADICGGMLCPSLASRDQYLAWMELSGLEIVQAENIADQVKETWERCTELVERPAIKAVLRFTDEQTQRFVETFPAMRRAYAERAIGYGMFAARKAK